ncbi:uncharacterized protein LOC128093392 [Culex pipiens pallens]|uniref:uncharacterized protein LOC128093392 n=1 Tax=Culex pipiens pallens TaxID=42434 RepID=UPI0022AB1F79|nr:uncharacterized protein LOC128093392 [Culex pipiens pallens]
MLTNILVVPVTGVGRGHLCEPKQQQRKVGGAGAGRGRGESWFSKKDKASLLQDLQLFHDRSWTQFMRLPKIGGRYVDLHRLYSVVVARWTKLKLKQIYIRFSNMYDKVNFNEDQFTPFLNGPSVRKPQVLELTYSDYCQRLERDPTNLIKNIYLEYRRSHRDLELSVQALYFPAGKRRLPFPNQQQMANSSKPVLMMAGNETTLFSTTLSRSKMKAAMLLPNKTSIRNLLSMGPSDVTGGVP